MQKKNAHRKVIIGFITAVLCIAFFVILTYMNMRYSNRESKKVDESLQTLLLVENVISDVKSIESAQRGYALSGNEVFLEGNIRGSRRLLDHMNQLDSRRETKKLAELHDLVSQKLEFTGSVIHARELHGFDSAISIINTGRGLSLMQQIEKTGLEIENQHRLILNESNSSRKQASNDFAWHFLILALFVYAILFINYRTIRKDIFKQVDYEDRLKENDMMISSIADPIVATDMKFNITKWNEATEMLLGWKKDEVIGKNSNSILKSVFIDSSMDDFRERLETDGKWEGEVILKHKDGHDVYIQSKVTYILDVNQNRKGAITIISDITRLKLMEQRLQTLADELEREVVEKSIELEGVYGRIGDAVIALDNEWRYTYMNSKAEELHYNSAVNFIGKNIFEALPAIEGSEFQKAALKAKKSMEPVRFEEFWEESGQWFETVMYPSEDGLSVYYHVITPRKLAELELEKVNADLDKKVKELAHLNERFLLVAKATNDAIWDWDIKNNKISGNETFSKLYDIEFGASINSEVYISRVHPDDMVQLKQNYNDAVNNKDLIVKEEYRFRISDGTYKYISDRAYIMYDENGEAYRMLGAMQDITNEMTAQQQLIIEKQLSDSIINSLPGIFYLYNKEGKFLRWNNNLELLSGYNESEVLASHPLDLFPEEYKELVKQKVDDVFEKGEPQTVETDLEVKSGEKIPFYFTGVRVLYEGEFCLMGIGLDMTDKARFQNQLIESEEKFRTLIEQASDGIFISNQLGEYVVVNSSAASLTGYSIDELLKMKMQEIIFESHREPSKLRIKEMLRGEAVVHEKLIRKKNGSFINVEISSKLLRDGRFQAIIRDITVRKRTEDRLKHSEEKRRLIMNSALDAIICCDTHGLITFWNPQAENIFGWKAEEVFGKVLSNLIIPERFRARHEVGIGEYLLTGEGQIFNVLLQQPAINREGKEFPVELTIIPIKQGDEEFFCLFLRDITDRKHAEEEVRLSEHKYRLLFEQNPMPMWMISLPERKFLAVNNAAISAYGYSREEFLSMDISQIRPVEDIPLLDQMKNDFDNKVNEAGTFRHKKKDGSVIKVNIISHNIINEGKHAKLILANDVTEKLRAEEELKASHEELRQLAVHLQTIRESERTHMAREIHDELGQQLTGLKMDIAWISKKLQGSDDKIKAKMKDALLLIDETVKTVRRLSSQLRPSILDDLGLVAALDWQSEEFEKRSEIQTQFSSNILEIELPAEKVTGIFRIYQECLTNVMRHAEATEVVSTLIVDDEQLTLRINDNGNGFDLKEIENKKTLGLLGMKERTLLMGGSYEISSIPGQGTTVELTVPIAKD